MRSTINRNNASHQVLRIDVHRACAVERQFTGGLQSINGNDFIVLRLFCTIGVDAANRGVIASLSTLRALVARVWGSRSRQAHHRAMPVEGAGNPVRSVGRTGHGGGTRRHGPSGAGSRVFHRLWKACELRVGALGLRILSRLVRGEAVPSRVGPGPGRPECSAKWKVP